MKTVLLALLMLALAGCGAGGSSPATPDQVSAACNASAAAGTACFQQEGQQLTAIDFGDSVSLGWSAYARHDLCGVVDLRHDAWEHEDVDLCGPLKPYFVGQAVADGINNGFSATQLVGAEAELANTTKHFNVILFNSGYHDMQRSPRNPANNVPLAAYRANLESLAQLYEQHGDIVIWLDAMPLGGDRAYAGDTYVLAADLPAYNAVGRAVAAEHGFYQLSWDGVAQHDPRPDENIHFTQGGYEDLAQQVTACVLTALNQAQTERCHR